uniref:Peptidase M12B domain-containing protein n=1 Tax=Mola mola TaxID=94237 RepID=A0A3Q3WVT9_MOLML
QIFLTLLIWHFTDKSRGGDFDQAKDYEVVRPVRLHSVRKRDTENVRPETVKYAMTLGGRNIEMQLEKNSELVTKDYTETHYEDDGTQVTTTPNDIDHCYYHGRIVNDSQSSVSISTCEGLRGYFRTSAQRYLIEPLTGSDEGDHAVTTFSGNNSTPAVCGVTNASWSTDFEPPTGFSRSRSGVTTVPGQKSAVLKLKGDINKRCPCLLSYLVALRKRIFEIVNFVNVVYKPLRTFIALVGLEIWSNRDLISMTRPAGANLDAFMKWRNSELLKRKKHDNAHLIRYKWAEFYVNHARSTYLVMLVRIFWDVVMGFGFRGKSIQLSLSHVFLLRALVFITQSCFRKCTHLHVSVLAPKEVSPSCVCVCAHITCITLDLMSETVF